MKHAGGRLLAELVGNAIRHAQSPIQLRLVDNVRRPEFIQKTLYERARAGERQAAAPAAPAASPAEELARLADLRDRGVLSEEEFQAQKARLLGS